MTWWEEEDISVYNRMELLQAVEDRDASLLIPALSKGDLITCWLSQHRAYVIMVFPTGKPIQLTYINYTYYIASNVMRKVG